MKTRTMYMHTLDERPASIQRTGDDVWLAFIGGRSKVQLCASLSEIRRQWNECLDVAQLEGKNVAEEFKRYGYVLVEVPA